MIRLFSKSGSKEVLILNECFTDQVWDIEKRNVIRLLKSRGYQKAVEILEGNSFKLCNGTNEFNDEFCILYFRAPLDRYLSIADDYEKKGKVKIAYENIAYALSESGHPIRFIVLELNAELNLEVLPVEHPILEISSDAVQRALCDAQNLIKDSGAASGVDRVHTAFYGYLKAVAKKAGIPHTEDSDVTEIFKLLRTKHPALIPREPRKDDVEKVLRSIANIVNVLNPIRNRASGAHPNDLVLNEPEAMLVINTVNTLLHYIDARLLESDV